MKIVSDLLVSVIADHAEIRHDYSGRCMCGEKCFGFISGNPEAAIAEIQADITGIYEPGELQQEFSELLQHTRRDSMGFDTILYFPGYQTTETDKEAEKMIDLTKLEWGLRPFRELEALAVYGARAIFRDGNIEFLQDRQSCIGEEEARKTLCTWINHKALPALKGHIRKHDWTPMTQETFTLETWSFLFEASPRASGYIYITAYLKGFSEFPDGKWSGNFIPEIGETILAVVNGIGRSEVLGYYLENGWIGVIAKPVQPPEWLIRQNGENAVCGLFGTEIKKASHGE